jgi:hypothetical protein
MATQPKTPEEQQKEKEELRRKQQEEQQKRDEEQRRNQSQQQSRQKSRDAAGSVVSPGASSTYSAAQQPVVTDPRGDRFMTRDEIKNLAGDIIPGEVGWLKLDEEGTPVEPVEMDYPFLEGKTQDQTFARVVGAPTHKYDEIVTPSGAPVTKFMNPEPTLWDEGMLARNPIPKENLPKREDKLPAGAPVINTPAMA